MRLTRRAKRRLAILAILVSTVGLLGTGLWFVQQEVKKSRAANAREIGMQAAQDGDWPLAMSNLSRAIAHNPADLEGLLVFARSRSLVPEDNRRHLKTALSLYNKASDLASENGNKEQLLEALDGTAQMAMVTGDLILLESVSLEIIDEESSNEDAIESMLQIMKLRGNWIPDDAELIRKDGRSDAEWLSALVEVDDRSALRWALEVLELNPDSTRAKSTALEILDSGESLNRQLMAGVANPETSLDVARAWFDTADPEDAASRLAYALECLRNGDNEEALLAVQEAEAIPGISPGKLLDAAGIRESIGGIENITRANELLRQAQDSVGDDSRVIQDLVLRFWMSGKANACYELIRKTNENDDVSLAIIGALIGAIDQLEEAPELAKKLELVGHDGDAQSLIKASKAQPILELVKARLQDPESPDAISEDEALKAASLAANLQPGNFLIQTLVGDVCQEYGRTGMALRAWTRAAEACRYSARPVGTRLVRGFISDQSYVRAFQAAFEFMRNTQSVTAAIGLCDAWVSMASQGLSGQDYMPQFDQWRTPLDLAKYLVARLEEGNDNVNSLLPMLVEAALLENDLETARAGVLKAIDGNASLGIMLRLIALSDRGGLDMEWDLVASAKEQIGSDAVPASLIATESAMLKKESRQEEAWEYAREQLEGKAEPEYKQLLATEMLEHSEFLGKSPEPAIRMLLDGDFDLNPQVLRRVHGLILNSSTLGQELNGDEVSRAEELSRQVQTRILRDLGPDSEQTVLGECLHTLRFGIENPDAVRQSILRADPLVSSGLSSADLDLAFVRLLNASGTDQYSRSVEILRSSLARRPGRFDLALILIDLLQKTGSFDEADEYLRQVWERRESAPVAVRNLMPALLDGQGNRTEVAEAICEIAERTGDIVNILACIRARYRAGEIDAANADLDELYLRPDRPSGVDVEMAARRVREGRVDDAINLLKESVAFSEVGQKEEAVASMLLQLGEITQLGEYLNQISGLERQTPTLLVIEATWACNQNVEDFSRADRNLDLALEMSENNLGILRRIGMLRVSVPGLRMLGDATKVTEVINLIKLIRPEQAELLSLLYRSTSDDGATFEPVQSDIDAAIRLTEDFPGFTGGWDLCIQILGASAELAEVQGELDRSFELSEQLLEMASLASARFPNNTNASRRLMNIQRRLGMLDEAASTIQQTISRSGPRPIIENAITLSGIELQRGNMNSARRALEPFANQISETANKNGLGFQYLVLARMGTNDIDAAWDLYTASDVDVSTNDGLIPWLIFTEAVPASAAIAAIEKARANNLSNEKNFSIVGALLAVALRTGSPDAFGQAESALDELISSEADPLQRVQLETRRAGLTTNTDPIATCLGYWDIWTNLKNSLGMNTEVDIERINQEIRLKRTVLILLNNYAATVANAILDGELVGDQATDLLENANEASNVLVSITADQPEVLDTLALVDLAREDYGEGETKAAKAIEMRPKNGSYRFTLARCLAGQGLIDEAREQARLSRLLLLRNEGPMDSQVQAVVAFLASF